MGIALLTLALMSDTAFAYHCYNASLSDQGRQQMDNAAAFYTVSGVLIELCEVTQEDADSIIAELIALGYPDLIGYVEISIAAHMAGGLEMWRSPNAEELWHDGKGIDHLGDDLESFEEDLIAAAAHYGYDLNAC